MTTGVLFEDWKFRISRFYQDWEELTAELGDRIDEIDEHRVLTLVDCDDANTSILKAGFHYVNRAGYYIIDPPWRDEDLNDCGCISDEQIEDYTGLDASTLLAPKERGAEAGMSDLRACHACGVIGDWPFGGYSEHRNLAAEPDSSPECPACHHQCCMPFPERCTAEEVAEWSAELVEKFRTRMLASDWRPAVRSGGFPPFHEWHRWYCGLCNDELDAQGPDSPYILLERDPDPDERRRPRRFGGAQPMVVVEAHRVCDWCAALCGHSARRAS